MTTPALYIGTFDTGVGGFTNYVNYVATVPFADPSWSSNSVEIPLNGSAKRDPIAANAHLNVLFNVLHAGGCTSVVRED